MNKNVRGFIAAIAIFVAMLLSYMFIFGQVAKPEILYSDLVKDISAGKIERLEISDTKAQATYREKAEDGKPKIIVYDIPSKELLYAQTGDEMDKQIESGRLTVTYPEASSAYAWLSLLVAVLYHYRYRYILELYDEKCRRRSRCDELRQDQDQGRRAGK